MVEVENKIQRYTSYKNSGVEWLGEIPEHWQVKPGFTILFESKEKNTGFKENTVLSLSYGNVIIKPKEKLTGLVPESFETYQLVEPGDIIIRPTDLQNDKTSLRTGLAKDKGIITSAYINLRIFKGYSNKYFHYYLHTIDINKVIYGLGSGLRQNISFEDFKRFPFPFPPLPEQTAIAQFLDDKTTKIDEAIAIKQQQIALLKERKQILIHKAVTRGLNDKVALKDSGVEWIGEIPEHWEVSKLFGLADFVRGNTPFSKDELLNKGSYVALQYGKTYKVDKIDENYSFYINDEFYKESQIVNDGDTILISTSETIEDLGHSAFYSRNDLGLLGGEQIMLHPYQEKLNGHYLYFLSKTFSKQLRKFATGIKVFRFNINDLKTIYISLPPLSEQREIANYIETASAKIDTAIGLKEQEIEKLQEYKSSLINSVVTGKVKVC
nr:restriction endonuclease subunit S [uncultured Brumimicrobium sp.]